MKRFVNQAAFTLVELMVSMLIFAIVGMGLMGYTSSALQELGNESRLSFATLELKNAISMLSSEVRMSSAISPYLPGSSSDLTNCSSALTISDDTIRFLIAEDDPSALSTGGIQPYYVAYRFDTDSGRLLRGEIQGNSTTSCTLPSGDPAGDGVAKTLAERVVRIDTDGDGLLEPAFSVTGETLSVNLGVQVLTNGGDFITQHFRTRVYLRTK